MELIKRILEKYDVNFSPGGLKVQTNAMNVFAGNTRMLLNGLLSPI